MVGATYLLVVADRIAFISPHLVSYRVSSLSASCPDPGFALCILPVDPLMMS